MQPDAGTSTALLPLDPRAFFARRWSGAGEWMSVVLPPLPVPCVVQARDRCRWDAAAGLLSDTIELSIGGIPLGRQEMSLRPA